jgi:hypothetical protein
LPIADLDLNLLVALDALIKESSVSGAAHRGWTARHEPYASP